MGNDDRKVDEELVQGVLLDDPGFLREMVQKVIQERLETEMSIRVGAAPYERIESRRGHCNATSLAKIFSAPVVRSSNCVAGTSCRSATAVTLCLCKR